MRFNLLGPELPRENAFVALLTFKRVSVAGWTVLSVAALLIFGLFVRFVPPSLEAAHLASLKEQLKKEQQIALFGASDRTELLAYQAAAAHFGEVRDSGYEVARELVRVANVWPDPSRVPASLKCYTPSDDGQSVTLTGVTADYKSYADTVASLQRRFLVVPQESPKGKHYEITLKVQQ